MAAVAAVRCGATPQRRPVGMVAPAGRRQSASLIAALWGRADCLMFLAAGLMLVPIALKFCLIWHFWRDAKQNPNFYRLMLLL